MKEQTAEGNTQKVVKTVRLQADDPKLEVLLSNPCDTFSVEIDGLYPILETLPSATNDSTLMVSRLKKMGFSMVSHGRGNAQDGPRMLYRELVKGKCRCEVTKVYHYHTKMADGYARLKVTETVDCNVDIPVIND